MKTNSFTSGDDGFSISSAQVKGYFSMSERHYHDKYELYYLRAGERFYFVKDKVFHIRKGCLVLIKEGQLHKTTDAEKPDHERVLIYFRKSFIETVNKSTLSILELLDSKSYFVAELSIKEQRTAENVFVEMFQEAEGKADYYKICLQGLLLRLLANIGRYTGLTDADNFLSSSPKHEKISEVVRYINEHYLEELTIPLLAESFYISPYYLSRIFKETTGFTLLEYINLARVKAAEELLINTGLKVIEIAEKSGFGSVSQFNRVFKQVTGYSPLNCRKASKNI
ncbi:bifunctional transcriptional activator/DNA repair enzyme AdaA [Ruminiclostridium hungatei]|uniref:Bifunctional transcriptional activator/DNA repair enzyme AdaA n=1 Tax=Ruminiclostridium hungatei TaxID=48256 RepID=A0A1V4SRB0_RUMHU|nr:AraC family transcriptional regulator [Ruminiclostridium hungatei]OPX45757.1 bifunctional transcriptional activator/DNA repair enzyme AdaA [Ruminiclostridium hungatei]